MTSRLSRSEAKAAGLRRYFTGVPCPRGHIVERIVSTAACSECARLSSNAFKKKHRARTAAASRAWRERNGEKVRALKRTWNAANPEGQKVRARRWYEANREKANKQHYAWAARNPEKVRDAAARRRARAMRQKPAWADQSAIDAIYAECQAQRERGVDVHVDHVVPLRGKRVSGLHVADNLQIIPAAINRRKSNHF